MAKELKRKILSELVDRFRSANDFLLADPTGLNGPTAVELRSFLRKRNVRLQVVKNTLCKLALTRLGIEGFDKKVFEGQTCVVHGDCDAIELCKSVLDWRSDKKVLRIKAGHLEGKVFTEQEILRISKLGSRNSIISQVVSTLEMPIYQFVATLEGVIGSLILTLEALKEKKSTSPHGTQQNGEKK